MWHRMCLLNPLLMLRYIFHVRSLPCLAYTASTMNHDKGLA